MKNHSEGYIRNVKTLQISPPCKSRSALDLFFQENTAIAEVWENSCIGKIFIACQGQFINYLHVIITSGVNIIFNHILYTEKDATGNATQCSFEITLDPPLCVGESGAVVTVNAFAQVINSGTLNVLYCTDCCQ